MAFIEVRNLFKRFNKVVAVNHIDLEVKEGEMLTLLGPSGCGKTTTSPCFRRDLSIRQKGESAWYSKTMPYGRI
jgi:ABC-type multidrug transport system ATPase subunit